jgi:ubiquinone/menaquinone biosynthesis C-methylase UbiE
VQRFYKYHAIFYDFTRWMILHGRAQAVERMQLQPDSRVLEVGCGTGLNFAHVAKRLGAEGELVGLDFSADMLKRAERRVAARGWQNIELTQGDATQMQLGRQFDAIFFAYSLTMIPDWRAALDRAWEHLAPGGRIVVLDFSAFHGWGPLAPVMRAWLRANHVETQQPYGEELAKRCDRSEVTTWLGGYNFTAIGWKDR